MQRYRTAVSSDGSGGTASVQHTLKHTEGSTGDQVPAVQLHTLKAYGCGSPAASGARSIEQYSSAVCSSTFGI